MAASASPEKTESKLTLNHRLASVCNHVFELELPGLGELSSHTCLMNHATIRLVISKISQLAYDNAADFISDFTLFLTYAALLFGNTHWEAMNLVQTAFTSETFRLMGTMDTDRVIATPMSGVPTPILHQMHMHLRACMQPKTGAGGSGSSSSGGGGSGSVQQQQVINVGHFFNVAYETGLKGGYAMTQNVYSEKERKKKRAERERIVYEQSVAKAIAASAENKDSDDEAADA